MPKMLEQVRRTAEQVRIGFEGNNRGRCLDASHALVECLSSQGIVAACQFGTFNGHRHAWVDIWTDEGCVICDLTADQFGAYPPIILGRMIDFPEYTFEET